jgi:streptogramin lyase
VFCRVFSLRDVAVTSLSVLLLGTCAVAAQSLPVGVSHIGTEEGLSSDVVTSLLLDRRGFLWIGTVDGLNRFDGEDFRVYRSNAQDSLSIPNNWVTGLSEDRSGRLWVSTFFGDLCRFDPFDESFQCHAVAPLGEEGLSSNEVFYAIEDRFVDDVLWLATDSGLYRFDATTSSFDRYGHVDPDGHASPCRPHSERRGRCTYARTVFQDRRGIVWTGSWEVGIGGFDPSTETFKFFPGVLADRPTASNPGVMSIYEAPSRPGLLWVGVAGGLRTVDVETGEIVRFSLPREESTAWIHASFEDSAGRMWFASDDGLLTLSDDGTHLRTVLNAGGQLAVRAILEDFSGELWAGSWGEGLFKLETDRMNAVSFHAQPGDVRAFLETAEGHILSAVSSGIVIEDRDGRELSQIRIPGLIPNDLALDSDGDLWIMTATGGILRLEFEQSLEGFLSRSNQGPAAFFADDYDFSACAQSAVPLPESTPHEHTLRTPSGSKAGRITHFLPRDWHDARPIQTRYRTETRVGFFRLQHLYLDPADSTSLWVSVRRGGLFRVETCSRSCARETGPCWRPPAQACIDTDRTSRTLNWWPWILRVPAPPFAFTE